MRYATPEEAQASMAHIIAEREDLLETHVVKVAFARQPLFGLDGGCDHRNSGKWAGHRNARNDPRR